MNGLRTRLLEAGSGEPLLLIHGLGGSANGWGLNIGPLSRLFHVYAPDLIGFGLSDKPRIEYSIADFVGFIISLADELNLASMHLVGSSMGGQICASLAIMNPDRIRRLVLVASAGISTQITKSLKLYSLPPKDLRELIKVLQSLVFDPSVISKEAAEFTFACLKQMGAKEAFNKALRASSREPRLQQRLSAIRSPTLIVWGKDDPLIPVSTAYKFVNGIMGARLKLFDQCGHLPQLEKPTLFNEVVVRFLLEMD